MVRVLSCKSSRDSTMWQMMVTERFVGEGEREREKEFYDTLSPPAGLDQWEECQRPESEVAAV